MRAKLSLIHETVKCECVWTDGEARNELLDCFVRHLIHHFTESECAEIFKDILISVHNFGNRRDIEILVIGAFDMIADHVIDLAALEDSKLVTWLTCFMSLLCKMVSLSSFSFL